MRNPFSDLGVPRLDEPAGEEVSGAFTCQERDCWSTVTRAKYIEQFRLLTYACEKGHTNKVEDFRLDG